ncbi:MAG: TraY domain-containing protein [Candidatus Melainabacteria bacterium]|nr:TraY domain-containing protein [Candidatus Melainabacteria bacterium]
MTTSVRFDDLIEKRLDELAKKTGRSKSFYIRELVESHLDDLEDYYLGNSGLEAVREGKEKIHSSASVREQLGLDD